MLRFSFLRPCRWLRTKDESTTNQIVRPNSHKGFMKANGPSVGQEHIDRTNEPHLSSMNPNCLHEFLYKDVVNRTNVFIGSPSCSIHIPIEFRRISGHEIVIHQRKYVRFSRESAFSIDSFNYKCFALRIASFVTYRH